MSIGRWLRTLQEALDPAAADDSTPRPWWRAPDDSWPRNLALEDALRRDPSSEPHLTVYADWLQEQGDVRGEVLAAALAGREEAHVWGAEHVQPGAALEGWMLGPLARTLEIGPKHAERLKLVPFSFASCCILHTLRLFAHPEASASILRGRRAPCPIREVLLSAGYEDLTPVWTALGEIPTVYVHKARELGRIRAPWVEFLSLRSVARRAYEDLAESSLPALTTLELRAEPDDPGARLAAAVAALPLLETVRVRSKCSGAFVTRLIEGGAGAKIRRLVLPGARWDTMHALAFHADSFERIEHLTLPGMTRFAERYDLEKSFGERAEIEWTLASGLIR